MEKNNWEPEDKLIAKMLQQIKTDESANEAVEENIMRTVIVKKNYAERIAKFQSRAKLCVKISLALLLIVGIFTTREISQNELTGIQAMYASVFIIISMGLIFVELELSRKINKKAA